jgi:hypothetical protein
MYAIETVNSAYFIDIGGLQALDLNFLIGNSQHFPLMIAAAKGR